MRIHIRRVKVNESTNRLLHISYEEKCHILFKGITGVIYYKRGKAMASVIFFAAGIQNEQELVSLVQSLSHVRLCDPMNHSTPGLPVHYQLPEFTQTHVHRVSDAIQPSHPLSSPSPPAPNPSQHQSLFQ